MDTMLTVLIIILIIIRLMSLLVQGIIYIYLNRKSPGMKTIFDELVQELIIGGIMSSLTADVATCGFGPLSVDTAVLIVLLQRFSAQFWFMQIFMTFLVRYLCIFHATTIHSILDHFISVGCRMVCFTWACSTTVYDYTNHDFEKIKNLNFMTHEVINAEVVVVSQVSVQCIICVDLLFIAFVMARIECYKWKIQNSEMPISKGTIRLILAILLIIGITVVIRLSMSLTLQSNALLFHMAITFILFVVIPLLMICRNEKMKIFALAAWSRNNVVSPV